MAVQFAPYVTNGLGVRQLVDGVYGVNGAAATTYATDANRVAQRVPVEWVPNTPFYEEMTFIGRTGSGGRVWVQDSTGVEYNIYPADLSRYLAAGLVNGATIAGRWIVAKKSTAYGIQLLDV